MVKGVKKTPTDSEELLRYTIRRKKKNKSVQEHRDRTRIAIDNGKKMEAKYKSRKIGNEDLKERFADSEEEKRLLLDFLRTHQFVLTTNSAGPTPNIPSQHLQQPPHQHQSMAAQPTLGYPAQNYHQPAIGHTEATVPISSYPAPIQQHPVYNQMSEGGNMSSYSDQHTYPAQTHVRPSEFCLPNFPARNYEHENHHNFQTAYSDNCTDTSEPFSDWFAHNHLQGDPFETMTADDGDEFVATNFGPIAVAPVMK